MAMNLLFVGAFTALSLPAPHAGLALATSLGAFVNAGLLYRYLRRDRVYTPGSDWRWLALRGSLGQHGDLMKVQSY